MHCNAKIERHMFYWILHGIEFRIESASYGAKLLLPGAPEATSLRGDCG